MPVSAVVCIVLSAWWTCGRRKGGLQWKLQCDVEGAKPRSELSSGSLSKAQVDDGGLAGAGNRRRPNRINACCTRRGDTPTADQIMPWRRWT